MKPFFTMVRGTRLALVAAVLSACGHAAERVRVPAGTYSVGCSDAGACDANRARSLQIGSFAIDKTLVTVSEYRACVDDGACPALDGWNSTGWFSTDSQEIVGVVPRLANAFCRHRGGRLPSNAEWEIATRGPSGNLYPWGNQWEDDKVIADRNFGRSKHSDVSFLYRAAGTRPDVRSYFGVEDTTGTGPEYVSDDGKRVQLRGCGNRGFSEQLKEECKLVRVEEPPLNVYAGFRCAYSQ